MVSLVDLVGSEEKLLVKNVQSLGEAYALLGELLWQNIRKKD